MTKTYSTLVTLNVRHIRWALIAVYAPSTGSLALNLSNSRRSGYTNAKMVTTPVYAVETLSRLLFETAATKAAEDYFMEVLPKVVHDLMAELPELEC